MASRGSVGPQQHNQRYRHQGCDEKRVEVIGKADRLRLSENLSVMIIPTTYKTAVPFLLILAILYFRPDGIFGERTK